MKSNMQIKIGLFLLFRIAKWTGFDIQPCHKSWKTPKQVADRIENEARLALAARQA